MKLLFFMLVSCLILNDGVLQGDERVLFLAASELLDKLIFNDPISALALEYYAARQIGWIIGTTPFLIISELLRVLGANPIAYEYIFTLSGPIYFILSIICVTEICQKLQLSHTKSFFLLVTVFTGTNFSSFATGGSSETFLIFLISFWIRSLYFGDRPDGLIIFFEVLIILTKPYFAALLLIRQHPLLSIRSFCLIVCMVGIIWIHNLYGFQPDMSDPSLLVLRPSVNYFYANVINVFFSIGYGAIFTNLFLLCLAFLGLKLSKYSLKFITYFLVSMITSGVFLSFYPFWHGIESVSGPRYIQPIFLLLVPLVIHAFSNLRNTTCATISALFLLLNSATLDIRNSLVFEYSDLKMPRIERYFQLSHDSIKLHPIIFANTLMFSDGLLLKTESGEEFSISKNNITPSSGMSRFLIILLKFSEIDHQFVDIFSNKVAISSLKGDIKFNFKFSFIITLLTNLSLCFSIFLFTKMMWRGRHL